MLLRSLTDNTISSLPDEAAQGLIARGLAEQVSRIEPGGSGLSGIAAPGVTVSIYADGGSSPIAAVTADAAGRWSYTPTGVPAFDAKGVSTQSHVYTAKAAAAAPVAPINATPPKVPAGSFGPPQVGGALTADLGSWTGVAALAVQWLRNGAAISGATSASYTLTSADLGAVLAVTVTATNSAGSTTVRSQPTLPVVAAHVTITPSNVGIQ